MHLYQSLRKDKRGVDLISDTLPFGRLWYADPNAVANVIGYAEHCSCSHHAAIRVYDDAGNVIGNAPAHGRFQRMVATINAPIENVNILAWQKAWDFARQTKVLQTGGEILPNLGVTKPSESGVRVKKALLSAFSAPLRGLGN